MPNISTTRQLKGVEGATNVERIKTNTIKFTHDGVETVRYYYTDLVSRKPNRDLVVHATDKSPWLVDRVNLALQVFGSPVTARWDTVHGMLLADNVPQTMNATRMFSLHDRVHDARGVVLPLGRILFGYMYLEGLVPYPISSFDYVVAPFDWGQRNLVLPTVANKRNTSIYHRAGEIEFVTQPVTKDGVLLDRIRLSFTDQKKGSQDHEDV
jgi:hypothetical protein